MGFIPISIEKYIKKHLKSNPKEKEKDVRASLQRALKDYQDGKKCSCGNDIWVIGSASTGNMCYTCITGEGFPEDDYEIDTAIIKRENKKGRRHINDIDPTKICGMFDDDGYEINADLIKKPSLCLTCKNDAYDDPEEQMLCTLNRYDQRNEKVFKCGSYRKNIETKNN